MALKKTKKLRVFCIFHETILERAPSQLLLQFLDGGGDVVADLYFLHIFYLIPLMFLGHQNPVIYRV